MGWGEAHQLRSLCDHEDPYPNNMMPSPDLHAYVHIHSHVHTHVHTCTHIHSHTCAHAHIYINLLKTGTEGSWIQSYSGLTLAAWGFRLDPKHLPPPKKRKYSLLTINLVSRRKYTIEVCLVRPTHNSRTREAWGGDWGQPGLQNHTHTHTQSDIGL